MKAFREDFWLLERTDNEFRKTKKRSSSSLESRIGEGMQGLEEDGMGLEKE